LRSCLRKVLCRGWILYISLMDYEIKVSGLGTFVHVIILTDITSEMGMQFLRDAVRLGKQRHMSGMLVDERGHRNLMSNTDQYNLAQSGCSEAGMDRGWKICFIKDVDDKTLDFLETVMLNAGYTVRIFIGEAEAISWIQEETGLQPRR
jgi:hypothetical protein